MNFNKTIMAASILAVASTVANEATGAEIISRPDFKVVDGKMTPELMEAFGRVTDPQVSPDKKKILYNVEFISLKADKGNKELWTMNIDGSNPQKSPTPQKARLALFGSKRHKDCVPFIHRRRNAAFHYGSKRRKPQTNFQC